VKLSLAEPVCACAGAPSTAASIRDAESSRLDMVYFPRLIEILPATDSRSSIRGVPADAPPSPRTPVRALPKLPRGLRRAKKPGRSPESGKSELTDPRPERACTVVAAAGGR